MVTFDTNWRIVFYVNLTLNFKLLQNLKKSCLIIFVPSLVNLMLKIKSADIIEKISIPREGGTWDEKRDGKEKKKFDRWGIPKRTEKYVGKDLCMSLAWEKMYFNDFEI